MYRKSILLLWVCSSLLFASVVIAQQDDAVFDDQPQDYYAVDGDSDSGADDNENSDQDLEEQDDFDDYDGSDEYYTKYNFTLESGESLPRSENSKRYHSDIEKVLAGADFAQKETVTGRRFKDVTDEETREEKFPEWIIDLVKSIESMSGGLKIFASILEILVWSLFIGLIVFLFIKYRTQLQGWASNIGVNEIEPELPISLFGLDIQKDSIPDDVVKEAKQYWLEGDQRQAVATLLRASLIKLLHEHGCRFFSSDTEAECCDRIDQQAPQSVSNYMRELVAVWQRVAYAHLDPSEEQFDRLCAQWREVFL